MVLVFLHLAASVILVIIAWKALIRLHRSLCRMAVSAPLVDIARPARHFLPPAHLVHSTTSLAGVLKSTVLLAFQAITALARVTRSQLRSAVQDTIVLVLL
jgi:hypothetical protein